MKLVILLNDQVKKLHLSDDEKLSLRKITKLLSENRLDTTPPPSSQPKTVRDILNQSNVFNWQLNNDSLNESSYDTTGRTSLLVKQTIDDDVLSIMKNSDKTTWDTLDILIKQVNLQNEKLNAILGACESTNNAPIASPLLQC